MLRCDRSVAGMAPVRLGFTKRITIYGFLAFRLWTVVHGPYQTQPNTHEDTVDTFESNLLFEMLTTILVIIADGIRQTAEIPFRC